MQKTVVINSPAQSYSKIIWKRFTRNRLAVWSLRFVVLILIIALFADFIANEKPLYCKYKGENYFPVIKEYGVKLGITKWPKEFLNVSWKDLEFESEAWPLIPYLPTNLDFANAQFVGPFDEQKIRSVRWKHWLGTDALGQDVLSGLIHGTRIAISVGVISMGVAALIGIFMGALAGFFGDQKLKLSRTRIFLNLLFLVPAFFYAFHVRAFLLEDALAKSFFYFLFQLFISLLIFFCIMFFANIIGKLFEKNPGLRKKRNVPVDIIISRFIEVFNSIPKILLILSIIAIVRPSIFLLMAIIGFTSWTGIAGFMRGELLKVRSLEYIESAEALGFGRLRIIVKHAVPNALSPVFISIAFGVASAILIESTLSFLGIGVPAETVTWGKLLAHAREAPQAWWLAIFPGFAIFATVTAFNLIGEGLTDAIDPKKN